MEAEATEIIRILREAGHIAYFAGGCVRDRLLGKAPVDFDIATDATPERVQEIFPRTVPVGAQFGVVLVVSRGEEYQVATFRADGAYIDGRHPEGVVYTTAEGDASRRDFTINGLFYDPIVQQVLDYVGGEADLQLRLLRAIGEPRKRFEEDRLRILRGVRFGATLAFDIEPATWEAIREYAPRIHDVSAERIREELVKIFLSPRRVAGFDLLDASGLLDELLPEITAMKGCDQPPEFHPEGDVYVHTRIMLDMLPEEVSLPLVFGVLFHDIGKVPTRQVDPTGRIRFNGHETVSARMTDAIMRRLKFSNDEIEATIEIVQHHMTFKDVQNMRVARLKRFMARPTFIDELELHRVDCQSSHGMLDNYHFLLAKEQEFANEPLIPEPLINGRDLIALGWTPGPVFKQVLEAVETLQLEGQLTSREEALAWVRDHQSKDLPK
ncbi:poly(A) polymerase [Terrimicrobium sacchariphilum]|uniref:Poly(A) polymerase n=1 Tax=Terrimicrobium sacchariphilum TaxID=690879 RepID=A0A146GFL6_TERSA|nr:CCA tRNA nucleotidyltransferase [Terrimicrobium sacchariphilum]GAT35407.1 poly(A) polymerase [Terrimicrobium sacchariphilum]